MPIYLYRAKDRKCDCDCCQKGVEVLQQLGELPLERCPKCGRTVEKCVSSFSLGISQSSLDDRAKEKGMHKLKRLSGGEYKKVY
jgi:predicted nucleic acid-binding Zn ribbon protein